MEYTVEYFIEKFEGIPEKLWLECELNNSAGGHCALGHCGVTNVSRPTKEGRALINIFYNHFKLADRTKSEVVTDINDGIKCFIPESLRLAHPKQRILAALYEIRDKQNKPLPIPEPETVKPEMNPIKQGRQYTTVVIDRGIIELKNIDSLKPVLN